MTFPSNYREGTTLFAVSGPIDAEAKRLAAEYIQKHKLKGRVKALGFKGCLVLVRV